MVDHDLHLYDCFLYVNFVFLGCDLSAHLRLFAAGNRVAGNRVVGNDGDDVVAIGPLEINYGVMRVWVCNSAAVSRQLLI